MASCLDTVNVESCFWFSNDAIKKHIMASAVAGLLFSVGWWLMIDANVVYPEAFSAGYYIWGALGTLSLIIVNSVPSRNDFSMNYDGLLGNSNTIWLFVGFVLGFASVFASVWIYFTDFYNNNKASKVPGLEILMQNILIFVSSVIYKFCRSDEDV